MLRHRARVPPVPREDPRGVLRTRILSDCQARVAFCLRIVVLLETVAPFEPAVPKSEQRQVVRADERHEGSGCS
jgi:hypothetical protein